ncbi:MAG: radical SAM protein [Thermodesulfovibrionales bacterium]|nr:radical SAM protein [Thermodesulfovibrionales bacterium]
MESIMRVCEIFLSIQGESSFVGLPCIFVRMTGCNLRCSYCDTTYAYTEGFYISEEELIEKIESYGVNLVEITGGEPLIQAKEVISLIDRLIKKRFKVLIETNGSVDIQGINPQAIIIMDIKTPGSGMHEKMHFTNLKHLKKDDEIKFIITDKKDYEWSKEIIFSFDLLNKNKILMSPAYGILRPQLLADWIIKDRLFIRLNLQIHKYIYGPEKRGV